MQPLTRQRTPESVHSWWSDSNPGLRGPTINLHTLAKPLMRQMYDREALKYLRKHRGTPLSTESIEIYLSYLFWKYVSPSTKEEIMEDLAERVTSEDVAHAVVHSDILPDIRSLLLLESDWETARSIIAALAWHHDPSTALAACSSLVDLLSDKNVDIIASAWRGLAFISYIQGPAKIVVEAKVLDHVQSGLSSPNMTVRYWTCLVVHRLSEDVSALPAVMRALPGFLVTLVKLLDDRNLSITVSIALHSIARSAEGAEATVAANILDVISRRLSAGDHLFQRKACDILEQLAKHDSTLAALVRAVPREHLVSLLRVKKKKIRKAAEQILITMDTYLESHPESSRRLNETHLPSRPETGAFRYDLDSIPEDLEPED